MDLGMAQAGRQADQVEEILSFIQPQELGNLASIKIAASNAAGIYEGNKCVYRYGEVSGSSHHRQCSGPGRLSRIRKAQLRFGHLAAPLSEEPAVIRRGYIHENGYQISLRVVGVWFANLDNAETLAVHASAESRGHSLICSTQSREVRIVPAADYLRNGRPM